MHYSANKVVDSKDPTTVQQNDIPHAYQNFYFQQSSTLYHALYLHSQMQNETAGAISALAEFLQHKDDCVPGRLEFQELVEKPEEGLLYTR